jgi:AbrB family looped-hinge helix DNA binding protein
MLQPLIRGATLTSRSITVQITSKGQVTIPQEIRMRLGLLPHTRVEFELGKRKAGDDTRGRRIVETLRGSADVRMTTGEIMALTRGETRPRKRRK